jgi:ubiquinone/menaquinone biosynthesis C-methylase UbiE
MVMCARADWVVKNLPARRLYRKLPSPYKAIRVYRDAFHGLLYEQSRAEVYRDISAFIDEAFTRPLDRRALLEADRRGASFERWEWHRAGLPWLSPRRWMYRGMRLAMETAGRLSEGIRIGLRSGFSSGLMLAYVYADRPRGWTPLGRMIDRFFLDSPGWSHIRVRRAQLQQLVREALGRLGERAAVRIFDVAGGPGHYWIDLARSHPTLHVRVRDFDAAALEEGRRRAADMPRVEFEQADAFDPRSYDRLGDGWQIGVISGLLELFPANRPVRTALEGAARAIEPGGYLIYTNQPWHPQIELIAETLSHGDGSPWVMRCRSQAEMDELVRAAGFEKVGQLADDDAIFTVSLARRG